MKPKKTQASKAPKTTADKPCPEDLNLPRPSREDYAGTVEEQIADFEETLDGYETDMESTGWDDLSEFRNRIDDLRARLKSLRSQSEELADAEDAEWPALHEDMEKALLDMSDAMRDIAVELGQVLPE